MPTHLELFRATVEHRPHGHYLFGASYTPDLAQRVCAHFGVETPAEVDDLVGVPRGAFIGIRRRQDLPTHDFSRYYADMAIPPGGKIGGNGVLSVPGTFHHFNHLVSPLRNVHTLKEVEAFPIAGVEQFDADMDEMTAKVREAHAAGKAVTGSIGHMYESAWQIRGYEEFLVDMYENPAICESILDRLCDTNTRAAELYARAGVDELRFGDDVANQNALMFSPDMWRRFIKSRWAKVCAAARAIKPDIQIFYHSDGNIMDIIPELIEIGITILNPCQPECMDLIEIKKQYGRHIVMHGTIGTQSTMPFGTPDEVRCVVRERKRTLGADGALILGPTHVLEPEVPIENIVAFFETCAETVA